MIELSLAEILKPIEGSNGEYSKDVALGATDQIMEAGWKKMLGYSESARDFFLLPESWFVDEHKKPSGSLDRI